MLPCAGGMASPSVINTGALAGGRVRSSRPGRKIAAVAPMPIASASPAMLKRTAKALIFCLQAAKRIAILSPCPLIRSLSPDRVQQFAVALLLLDPAQGGSLR